MGHAFVTRSIITSETKLASYELQNTNRKTEEVLVQYYSARGYKVSRPAFANLNKSQVDFYLDHHEIPMQIVNQL